jgi:hypothetical protein
MVFALPNQRVSLPATIVQNKYVLMELAFEGQVILLV